MGVAGSEQGRGRGMLKKTPHPRLLSGAGRGKGPGARIFRGSGHPVTNSNADSLLAFPSLSIFA